MDNFIKKNKGPLIAAGGSAGGLLILIIISAIANMPEDISWLGILSDLIWLVLIGAFLVGASLYARGHYLDFQYLETEEDLLIETGRAGEGKSVLVERSLMSDEVEKLFGTTDMNQVTKAVTAMYGELKELRAKSLSDQPDLSAELASKEDVITALKNERDEVKAQGEKWKTKAISSTQQIEQLRQELREHGKWEMVNEEQLATFFPTVNLGDGEEPFLSSNRRQRRLMQRLSAEGYSILKKTN